MTITPTRPTNINRPFARTGAKNTVPDTTASPLASFDDGFPPVTMQAISAGGVPPQGKDFNGILFDITTHTLWVNAGGQYQFDSALSTAMGGYPAGMVLQSNDGSSAYVSLVANNTTDFNSTPSSIGTLWSPWAGNSSSLIVITTTGGNITLTADQAKAKIIYVQGTLASDATLIFPSAYGSWIVENATFGNFNLLCKTSGGSVTPLVFQNGVAVNSVMCDGNNIRFTNSSAITATNGDGSTQIANTLFVQRAVAQVGGYYQDTGSTNAYVVATIPVTPSYVNGQSFRFRAAHANTGASTFNAGPGAVTLTREGGAALEANDILTTQVVTVTYVAASTSFVINGVVASDFLDSPALRGTPTAPTPAPGDNSTIVATTAFVQTAQSTSTFNLGLYMQGTLM